MGYWLLRVSGRICTTASDDGLGGRTISNVGDSIGG